MRVKLLITLVLMLASLMIAPAATAQFQSLTETCNKPEAASSPVCQQYHQQQASKQNPLTEKIQNVTNIFAMLTGLFAVAIIIYGGFVFVTAGGAVGGQRSSDSPTRAKQARAMVTGAVIGLVIVALGWTIVTFVTNNLIQ